MLAYAVGIAADIADGGLDLQGDRGEALRKGVVNLPSQSRAFVAAREHRALLGQAGAFDGHADLQSDGAEKSELVCFEAAHGRRGDVHDAEWLLLEREGDGSVMREAVRQIGLPRADCGAQTRALHHIDVARRQRAVAKFFDAQAPRTGHPHRLLQIRREIAGRCAVHVTGVGIDKPHPPCLQAEKAGDELERAVECLLHCR